MRLPFAAKRRADGSWAPHLAAFHRQLRPLPEDAAIMNRIPGKIVPEARSLRSHFDHGSVPDFNYV